MADKTLKDAFYETLKDVYYAERQSVRAFPPALGGVHIAALALPRKT